MRRVLLGLSLSLAAAVGSLVFTGSAVAQVGNPFGCTASTYGETVLGATVADPATANPAVTPCASDTAETGEESPNTEVPGLSVSLGPIVAVTTLGTAEVSGSTVYTGGTSTSTVDAFDLSIPAGVSIGMTTPSSVYVDYQCVDNQLQTSYGSTLREITIDGKAYSLTGQPQNLSTGGATILVNQHTSTSSSDTETMLEFSLPLSSAVMTVGVAQASAAGNSSCAGTASATVSAGGNAGGTAGGNSGGSAGSSGNGGGSVYASLCPTGSILLGSSCVIPGTDVVVPSMASGDIDGAGVISLVQARKLYKSSCLAGSGPLYVVVGTKKADTITVRNVRLRVLGLSGNDKIVVNSGKNTCVDGGAGNNTIIDRSKTMAFLYAGAGNNRITIGNGNAYAFGGNGKDVISAGNGNDTLVAGRGHTVITAGNGVDHLIGGGGSSRLTAHGKHAYLSSKHGLAVGYVQADNASYARRHGVKMVHILG
jgi:Ca2+-binding RTX toxin-like protein